MTELLKELFIGSVISSLKLSVVIILLLLLTKPITRRYTAGFRYYSWLAVMIIFLIPFNAAGISYKINIPVDMPAAEIRVNEATGGSYIPNGTESIPENAGGGEAPPSAAEKNIDIIAVSAAIWIAGGIVYLGAHLKRYVYYKRTIKRLSARSADESLLNILECEKDMLGISKKLRIKISPVVDTPMLLGLINPEIILPHDAYTEEELHLILRHELFHYKRKDILYQLITLVFVSIHWFNPIVYVMARAIELDGETSCDEKTLSTETYDKRLFYGDMLIRCLKTEIQKRSYITTTFFGGERGMKKRLALITSKRIRRKGSLAMIMIALLAVMLAVAAAASSIELVDSREMIRNSSKRDNTVIMDAGEYYEVFIGCDPIFESEGNIKLPLESFMVLLDYKTTSESEGGSVTISNGNRQIELSAGSDTAIVDGTAVALERGLQSDNGELYIYIEDIEKLFSYKTSYDPERNNVVLTVTPETPQAVKVIATPAPSPEGYTAPPTIKVIVREEGLKILMDDAEIDFPDAQPFIDSEDRTQVPIRMIAEMLGCEVDWNEKDRSVFISRTADDPVVLRVNDNRIFAGDTVVTMDTTPMIIDGRTYVPLLYVSEAFGINVFWE